MDLGEQWPRGIALPTIGILAGDPLPLHEIRVRVHAPGWPRGELRVHGRPMRGLDGNLEVVATFAEGLSEHPLVVRDADGDLLVALTRDSPAWHDREFLELLAVASAGGSRPVITVGLLGYGAIGAEHARALCETPGLRLGAVSDLNPERARAALDTNPGITVHATPEDLLGDPAIDVVVISTPPDSHAEWARRALHHRKHVVVEKPMALTTAECDDLLSRADSAGLVLSVYQNRRFDPDYRLVKHHVARGTVGEVFHVETFVGGYSHPCNYWHSDASVSGGALFDWGSHVVDQLLDLIEGRVEFVTALNHKRVWHDVTNADHARMTLHFEGGREATFVYSDLAAALKPRWYVLGTRGAITSEWREVSVVSRNAVGTLDEDILSASDAPARIRLHSADGDVTHLSNLPPAPHPFHADLALRLGYGIEPRVRGEQSRRVIAMLQAAEESAAMGGIPVKPS